MWKISILATFFFLLLFVHLERNQVESKRYETVITWKTRSWGCYHVVRYKEITSMSHSKCKVYCGGDSRCKMVQYLQPSCYLSLNRRYRTFGCTRRSILYLKYETKRLIPPPTKPPTTNPPTTESIGPTPKWVKHAENCLELESSYSDFKVKDEAECKLKCYLDEKCIVLEFRADHFICKLSNQWRFRKVKHCNHWGEIFLKDLKKCPVHGEICQENAVCTNTPKTYQCRCKPGYNKGIDGNCIKEINECLESWDVCDKNAVCIDTLESYECRCKVGYHKGIGKECIKDSGSLEDIDEGSKEDCAKNNIPCPENSVCIRKSVGKFECECIKGFEYNWHSKSCEDIDECRKLSKSKLGCTSMLKCFNTIGSYYCACSSGYKKVNGKCEDVDECAQGLCGENMECQNFPGSYACSCRKGYWEDMYWCNDVDECRGTDRVVCEEKQTCINVPGSYKCSCATPTGSNKPGNNKPRNDKPSNKKPSNNKPGYKKTGSNKPGVCKEKSSSVGKSGEGSLKNQNVVSFSGNSNMRFVTPAILKGNSTVSIRLTIRPDSGDGIIIYAEKVGLNKFFGLALKDTYLELSFNMGSGPEKLLSTLPLTVDTWHGIEVIFSKDKVGFSLNENLPLFQQSKYTGPLDVDDIFHIGGVASASDAIPNAKKNLHINSGFKGCLGFLRIGDVDYDLSYPGKHVKKQENIMPCEDVQDIDECSMKSNHSKCGVNSVCTNTIGKFRCSCKPGYEFPDEVLRICYDIDECKSGQIQCGKNAKCVNTDGGYYCTCKSGFYNFTKNSCEETRYYPLKDGWFVHLRKCESAKCKIRILKKEAIDGCKERCLRDPTCAMIKFRPSRGKCSLCQSTKFRSSNMPPGYCKVVKAYDFYMKATRNFQHLNKRSRVVETTEAPTTMPSDSKRRWIPLRGLCVHTHSYNPTHILTASECTRMCEAEPACVMAKFSSAASLCWLSKSRKMAPLGDGCDGKFRNIYDYFVKPIDQCDGIGRKCPDHSECLFEKGHRYCRCQNGFEQHGKQCKDINECRLYENLCGEHAHCVNTLGSYRCSCDRHYVGDGVICLHHNRRQVMSFGRGLASSN